jgi:hypothetical protein
MPATRRGAIKPASVSEEQPEKPMTSTPCSAILLPPLPSSPPKKNLPMHRHRPCATKNLEFASESTPPYASTKRRDCLIKSSFYVDRSLACSRSAVSHACLGGFPLRGTWHGLHARCLEETVVFFSLSLLLLYIVLHSCIVCQPLRTRYADIKTVTSFGTLLFAINLLTALGQRMILGDHHNVETHNTIRIHKIPS